MKIAAFTMVHNEDVFLPIWINHYGKHVGYENLYVIDDGSVDNSTDNLGPINVIKKNKSPLDEDVRAILISSFFEILLNNYDVVVFSDVDELIVVDPRVNNSFFEYIKKYSNLPITAIGFDIIHRLFYESDIVLENKLFSQRNFARFSPLYCKTLISSRPIRWSPGFHYSNIQRRFDENIYLFHLRAFDKNIAINRKNILNKILFSKNSLSKGHSIQFRISTDKYIKKYFDISQDDVNNSISTFNMDKYLHLFDDMHNFYEYRGDLWRIPERFIDTIELIDSISLSKKLSGCESIDATKIFDEAVSNIVNMSNLSEFRRNTFCPCGSGHRFKNCHGKRLV